MHCSVYGLGLQVNVPLQGLLGLGPARNIDVNIEIGSLPTPAELAVDEPAEAFYSASWTDDKGEPEFKAFRLNASGAIRMAYADGTVFIIDGQARRVWATIPPGLTVEDTAACLLGPIMGVLLRMRGIPCLHASAVALDGLAVGLVGESGAGKSTTAAAFARLGYPVLGDDVLALTDCGDHFLVRPAYPRVRLWPESVAGLFGAADALPLMTPGWDKRFLGLNTPGYHFQSEPLPLAAVYFLAPRLAGGGPPAVSSVSPAAALMTLVADSFATNFQDTAGRASEFDALARLVESVPLRRVAAPDDLSRIDTFCNCIVQDFRAQRATAEAVHAVQPC